MASLTEAPLPLNGLLNIQKNYLNDLAQLSTENKNVAGDLNDIRSRLDQINQSFNQANTSAEKTLTHQSKVEDILKKEHERLLSKKDEIDNIHYGKMRSVQLNDSYRKKQSEYIRIIVALIVAIILYIAFYLFLPQSIADILTVLLFVVLIFYSTKIVWEIYKRDNMNYDRLDLVPPAEANSLTRGDASAASASASASMVGDLCTGEVCCAEGSRWDASMNKCILACPDASNPITKGNQCIERASCVAPFKICGNACISETATCGTTVNTFSTLGEERIQTKTNEVKPYTPYEYNEYSPVM
jgi:ABC-type multidrug transport system fused ATPase/permease subunit